MDKVIIRDLRVQVIVGLNDWEREAAQEIIINIIMETDLRQAGESDDLGYSINYSVVGRKIIQHARTARRLTVEALAEDLARICLKEERVQRVVVRVEKPSAVHWAAAVGVEIERRRKD